MSDQPNIDRLVMLTHDGDTDAAAELLRQARLRNDPHRQAIALAGAEPSFNAWQDLTRFLEQHPTLRQDHFAELNALLDRHWPDDLRQIPGVSNNFWFQPETWPMLTPICRAWRFDSETFITSLYPLDERDMEWNESPIYQQICNPETWTRLSHIRELCLEASVPSWYRDEAPFNDNDSIELSAIKDGSYQLYRENVARNLLFQFLLMPIFANVRTLILRDETDALLYICQNSYNQRNLKSCAMHQSLERVSISAPHPPHGAFSWLADSKIQEISFHDVYRLDEYALDALVPPNAPATLRTIRLVNVKHFKPSKAQIKALERSHIQIVDANKPNRPWLHTKPRKKMTQSERESQHFIKALIADGALEIAHQTQSKLIQQLVAVWPQLSRRSHVGAAISDWLISRDEVLELHATDYALSWFVSRTIDETTRAKKKPTPQK